MKTEWNIDDKFTTPETGDTIFTVTSHNKFDVQAIDSRSRAGYTIFSKSYITKVNSESMKKDKRSYELERSFELWPMFANELDNERREAFVRGWREAASQFQSVIDEQAKQLEVYKTALANETESIKAMNEEIERLQKAIEQVRWQDLEDFDLMERKYENERQRSQKLLRTLTVIAANLTPDYRIEAANALSDYESTQSGDTGVKQG